MRSSTGGSRRSGILISFLVALALAATSGCGDDLPRSGADGGPGAGDVDGSGSGSGDAGDTVPTHAMAFAVATDFSTSGVASTVSVPDLDVTVNAVAGVASTDSVVRHLGHRLYVVNRFGQDNVTVLEDDDLSLVAQVSTGSGSNPQDVAAVGNTLFVAALGSPGVLVLDLDHPDDGVVDTIDLSALDPDDGLPNCHTVVAAGAQVAAVCGILDDDNFLNPRGPGVVAIIDPSSHQVITTVALTQERPFGFALATPADGALHGDVLVPSVPDFSAPGGPGCVEEVTVAGADSVDHGCLVDNSRLNGYVSALAYDEALDGVWFSVTTSFDPDDFGPHGYVAAYRVSDDEMDPHLTKSSERPMDLALCPTGHLVISDATRGVRVFTNDPRQEITAGALDLGFPPVSNGIVCY